VSGHDAAVVLVIGSVCAMIFLCTLANAWARRAASRAAELREARLLAEVTHRPRPADLLDLSHPQDRS
jgi:hypothetical protein